MNESAPPSNAIVGRLQKLRDALGEGLIERETPVRLALLAALSGEHLLLIGPPGTAKSELARRLRHAFAGATYFERLLTKFSVPEELFGPLSIKALGEDRYHRQTEGYLPTASVAFLDEIFKANSAILNSLLTLLNERLFDNGVERVKSPLIAVIGASNELPEQREQLDALYDRFMFRCHVPQLSAGAFPRLLELRGDTVPEPAEQLRFTPAELIQMQQEAGKVGVPAEVLDLLAALREFLQQQKIEVSDRRWRKILKTLQVSAYTNGRAEVSRWDCWLLQHCTWSRPEQRAAIQKWYEDRMGTVSQLDTADFVRWISELDRILKAEGAATEHGHDDKGSPLYIDPAQRKPTTARKGSRVNKDQYGRDQAPEEYGLGPYLQPKRYSAGHVQSRIASVAGVESDLKDFLSEVDQQIESIGTEVRNHLWVNSEFAGPASRVLEETKKQASKLTDRLSALRSGFDKLPRSATDEALSTALSARKPKK